MRDPVEIMAAELRRIAGDLIERRNHTHGPDADWCDRQLALVHAALGRAFP